MKPIAKALEATPPITQADLWPAEPLPLVREAEAGAPFPVEALGPLTQVAQVLEESIQAPMPLIASSLLAGASLVAQGHVDVKLDGRTCPTSLDFLTIAESGERKSAIDAQVLAPHRKHERALQEAAREQYQSYCNALELWERQRAEVLKDKKLDRKAALDALGKEPQAPFTGIYLTSEPTIEGLVKLLDTGWPSVGLFSDEGGSFVGGHAMNRDNQTKTITRLSSLWDGSAVDRVRAGEGASKLYGRRCAFHLMAQPRIAASLLGNTDIDNQGFTNRILVTYPESTAGERPYREIDLSTHPTYKRYFARMLGLLELSLPFEQDENGEPGRGLEPRALELNPEAKSLWIAFHDHVEKQLKAEFEPVRGFAAKIPEQALRLAGVLAWVPDPTVTTLSREHLEAGITLADWYLHERLRILNVASIKPEIAEAIKLLAWLRTQAGPVRTADVYQKGPSSLRTAEGARQALSILAEHGWVRVLESRPERWEVRP